MQPPPVGAGSRGGREVPGEAGSGYATHMALTVTCPLPVGWGHHSFRTLSEQGVRESKTVRGDVLCDDKVLCKLSYARMPGKLQSLCKL